MSDFRDLLRRLSDTGVEYILIGGVAAVIHGSARLTEDLDIVYRRSAENIDRVALALKPTNPYLRGAPPGLPFRWDRETIVCGLNFTLTTDLGPLNLFGEIPGGGGYDELRQAAAPVSAFGVECLCLGLEQLIQVKRAAGRPKDLEALAELEALHEEGRAAGV